MSAMKNYLLKLLENCSDEAFGQDAVEHAILTGAFKPSYVLETDLRFIFSPVPDPATALLEPARPETHYDRFCAAYRDTCRKNESVLAASYEHSGLLEEILRNVPLSQAA